MPCAPNLSAASGLDVIAGEPDVLPELLEFENVIVTPHIAGHAPEAEIAATALIIDNLDADFAGKPLVSRGGVIAAAALVVSVAA